MASTITLDEDLAREDDLDFLAALREADLSRLCQLKTNVDRGGPPWMRVAVERAIARVCPPAAATARRRARRVRT
jgi:hypothetical protein